MFGDSAIRTYRRDITDPNGQNYAVRFLESWVKQNGEWKLAAEWFKNMALQEIEWVIVEHFRVWAACT